MFAASITNALWMVASVGVVIGLGWTIRQIEPHWVSKDRRMFTCKVQAVRLDGTSSARWREAKAAVDDGEIRISVRGLGAGRPRPDQAHRIVGRSDRPPRRSQVYLLDGEPMWALRIPKSSKMTPILDEAVKR